MIDARLMSQESFSIRLSEDLPLGVRYSNLGALGHVVIVPSWFDPRLATDATVKALSRWSGVILRQPDTLTLEGAGLAWWLGEPDGSKGAVIKTAVSLTSGTLSAWVAALLAAAGTGLTVGTVINTGTNLTWSTRWTTVRQALDFVCSQVGAEWRVNPDGTLDAGTADALWGATPDVLIARRAGVGGTGPTPVEAVEISSSSNATEFANEVVALGKGEGPALPSSTSLTGSGIARWDGALATITRVVSAESVDSAGLASVAAEQRALWDEIEVGAAVTARLADPGRVLRPGQRVYVYEPSAGLTFAGQTVIAAGQVMTPVSRRLLGFSWPVQRGMGVFVKSPALSAVWVDVTPWVEWEADGVTPVDVELELGDIAGLRGEAAAQGSPVASTPIVERLSRPSPSGSYYGAAAANVALGTAASDVAAVTVVLTEPRNVLVVGAFDFEATAAGYTAAIGECVAGATLQPGWAIDRSNATGRFVTQSWLAALPAGSTVVKTQARKVAAGGTVQATAANSTITVVVI